ENLFALAVDEGIHEYRATTLKDLRAFCGEHAITLKTVSNKEEFGATLDEAFPKVNRGTKKKPCNICGVWRRYLINKHARQLGATKVVTGHNLDDEAQAITMNLFKANTDLAAHLGPISGVQDHDAFVRRVKPLYFCAEKETRLYAFLKQFVIEFVECPYARQGYRAKIQDMLNDFEAAYPGTKQGIINSFLALLPALQEAERKRPNSIQQCQRCGEPANNEVCNACKMVGVLQHA
ncbi:TIGR00269 family protein, partial [Candidatus Woesearchaeota archaeon]|nr:TIGR00269 family protein [Candidatus Woesearchaeota archaeon]